MKKSKSNQLSPEQIYAMNNPHILYVQYENGENKYRVHGVYARLEEAQSQREKLPKGKSQLLQMHINDVQPVLNISQIKKYQSSYTKTPSSPKKKNGDDSPWKGYLNS